MISEYQQGMMGNMGQVDKFIIIQLPLAYFGYPV